LAELAVLAGTDRAGLPGVSLELARELTRVALEEGGAQLSKVLDLLGRNWSSGLRGPGGDTNEHEDLFARRQTERGPVEQWLVDVSQPQQVVGVSLTAGFVWWLTRGGGLLAGILMVVPAWRQMDLLPVVTRAEEEDDEEDLGTAPAPFSITGLGARGLNPASTGQTPAGPEGEPEDDEAVASLFDQSRRR
jgi:hypothetical protein